MSNHRAIATVTATLQELLARIAGEAAEGATATNQRPDRREGPEKETPEINLFLYRSSVNPSFRNQDVPTRDSQGRLVSRPAIGIDLDYLLTFYGKGLQPHALLGRTVAALHAEPCLTAGQIRKLLEHNPTSSRSTEDKQALTGSDLAEQAERIYLQPIPLDLEELSKLWSVFFQVPYDLSIAYRASVVLIAAEEMPMAALPVHVVGGGAAATSLIPELQQVLPQLVNHDRPKSDPLLLRGRNLDKDLLVQFGEHDPIEPRSLTPSGDLEVVLPRDLPAGVTRVHLIKQMPAKIGGGRLPSNDAALVIRPKIIPPRFSQMTPRRNLKTMS